MRSKHAERAKAEAREIPDKLYFRIGEVAKLCGVPTYVLRFWESEFPQLKPNKSGTGQRLYRRREVEMALRIKTLLYDEGYTIAGARQTFAEGRKRQQEVEVIVAPLPLERAGLESLSANGLPVSRLRAELKEILGMLSAPVRRERADSAGGEGEAAPELFE